MYLNNISPDVLIGTLNYSQKSQVLKTRKFEKSQSFVPIN